MAGLSFFSGKRSHASGNNAASAAVSSNYHPAPPSSAPVAPNTNTNTNNHSNTHSNNNCNTSIPVAVPIAYLPPSGGGGGGVTCGRPTYEPPLSQPYQQHQQVQQQKYAPAPSNESQRRQQQQQQQQLPTTLVPFALPPTVTTAEVDHNIRLFHTATFAGRTLPHKMFLILSIVTGLTGMNNIIAHLMALLFYGQYENSMEVLLRWYTIGLCLLVIVIETNQTTFIQQSLVFQHFATRGIYYSFLGVLGLVEYDIGNQNNYRYKQYGFFGTNSGGSARFTITLPTAEGAGELYIWLTSWLMFCIGLVYILLGVFCLHQRYHQIVREFEQRCYVATHGGVGGGGEGGGLAQQQKYHPTRSAIVLD